MCYNIRGLGGPLRTMLCHFCFVGNNKLKNNEKSSHAKSDFKVIWVISATDWISLIHWQFIIFVPHVCANFIEKNEKLLSQINYYTPFPIYLETFHALFPFWNVQCSNTSFNRATSHYLGQYCYFNLIKYVPKYAIVIRFKMKLCITRFKIIYFLFVRFHTQYYIIWLGGTYSIL